MDTATISAAIAFSGVFISVIISFLSNRNLLKTEIEKLEASIELSYASKLVDKRLEFYPSIYQLLSNMVKKIKIASEGILGVEINLSDIIEFQKSYDELNSKFGVVFSSASGSYSYELRTYIIEILKEYHKIEFPDKIPPEIIERLGKKISSLEFSLKQDIGIYIVKFQDSKRKLQFEKYGDAIKYRETRKTTIKK